MFPDAPIYTLLYDEKKLGDWFPKERVRVSSIRPVLGFNHHLYLKKFPAAVEAFDFSEFDLVISSSSAFAHNIITNGKPKHLSYIHSPARYLWDRTHDVLDRAGKGLLGPLRRRWLEKQFHTLRIWDAESSDRADVLVAASNEIQRRIELYWRRESEVIHPPIDDFWLQTKNEKLETNNRKYFLIVSTLAAYKRIDLAVEACNMLKLPLIIAGEGRDALRLKAMAGPTVRFVGYKEGAELRSLYAGARATIFPGDEDFGLVPLESMACGTPVIAYRSGGALETVEDGKTGLFFDEPTAVSLAAALGGIDATSMDHDRMQATAARFSRKLFEKNIRSVVDRMMEERA